MSASLERLARNQSLFSEVNERIQYLAEVNERIGYLPEGATSEYVCECSSTECISTIELTVVEYERVRSNPTWFVIKPDHDVAQVERVVSRDRRVRGGREADPRGVHAGERSPFRWPRGIRVMSCVREASSTS